MISAMLLFMAGKNLLSLSSKDSKRFCSSCKMATAVNCFVSEQILKLDESVRLALVLILLTPYPLLKTVFSWLSIAMEIPGNESSYERCRSESSLLSLKRNVGCCCATSSKACKETRKNAAAIFMTESKDSSERRCSIFGSPGKGQNLEIYCVSLRTAVSI